MAENSAEPTDAGQGPGSTPRYNTDTRQPSVESLKAAILESLSWFSDNLVLVLDTNLTQIHEQFTVKFTDCQADDEDLLQKGQGPRKWVCPICQQHLVWRTGIQEGFPLSLSKHSQYLS